MSIVLLVIIYLSFISLGLPDASFGVAWPIMYQDLNTSIAMAGWVSFTVTAMTIVSSMLSGRLLKRFGTQRINLFSTLMTGLAMVGYALSPSIGWVLAFAIPLGFGGGSVDAGLNSYVALHYKAHHMNWLHSFWGFGATLGPIIMSKILAGSGTWRTGYWTVAVVQLSMAVVLLLTLPIWRKVERSQNDHDRSADETTASAASESGLSVSLESKRPVPQEPGLPVKQESGQPISPESATIESDFKRTNVRPAIRPPLHLVHTPGLFLALLTFLLYCGAEISMGLWGSSYLVSVRGLPVDTAGWWVSLYFGGITVGRFLTGFLALKWPTRRLIRLGLIASLGGTIMILIPSLSGLTLSGFVLVGLGFAPLFPGMIHETPIRFGPSDAQRIIGYQMATAFAGSTLFPPVLGWFAAEVSLVILPPVVLILIIALLISTERINRIC